MDYDGLVKIPRVWELKKYISVVSISHIEWHLYSTILGFEPAIPKLLLLSSTNSDPSICMYLGRQFPGLHHNEGAQGVVHSKV